MLPVRLSIAGNNISTLAVALIFSLLIVLFIMWLVLRKILDPKRILDLTLVSIIICVVFSRLFGVINSFYSYQDNILKIFEPRDNNFSLIGGVIGFIFVILTINRIFLKKEIIKQIFLENFLIAILIGGMILLLGITLSGRMLGVEIGSVIGLVYEDGMTRLPLGVFRILFLLIFLIVHNFLRKKTKIKPNILISVFLITIAAFEFGLNFFIMDYKKEIFNLINLEQLLSFIVFIVGLAILYQSRGNKYEFISENEQGDNIRRTSLDRANSQNKIDDFSYSFKDGGFSINQSDISLIDRLKILINSLKRKFKK